MLKPDTHNNIFVLTYGRKKPITKTNNQDNQIKIHDKYRPIYADKLKNEKIIQLKNNQGLIFYANSGGIDGAIHSEPKVEDNRIFISILPGTKDNIKTLEKIYTI